MCLSGDFLQQRIDATKTMIVNYEDAINAITIGGVETYLLDTGQTRQNVTKLNLKDMNTSLDGLYNRLATLCARQTGSGVTTVRPCW